MERTTLHRRFTALVLLMALVLPPALAGCGPMFFHPSKNHIENPALAGISREDVFFPSTDGVKLHGWVLRPSGPAKGALLFLHGNAENLSTHVNAVLWLVKEGYLVFTFDYRGYGKSEGTPDIPGVNRDGIAALDQVFRIGGVDAGRVAVLGQSLGGAVAVYAVANSPRRGDVKALIVDSAFAGYRRVVRDRLASLVLTWPLAYPASWTVEDGYSPERWIGTIAPVPAVVIHGMKDTIVPFSHGELLYELAKDPKGFWKVEGGGHVRALILPDVRAQFLAFLAAAFSPKENNSSLGAGVVRN
jgi:fermentation-respiration switch protein FrsA (DUF1100 family)